MVAPMHWKPACRVKKAATELSTPPLMPIIAFFIGYLAVSIPKSFFPEYTKTR